MNNDDNVFYPKDEFDPKDYKFDYVYNNDYIDNVISVDFNKEKVQSPNYYYDFVSKPIQTEEARAQLTVGISTSYLEKLETQLAKVSLALDNLLTYLHNKK